MREATPGPRRVDAAGPPLLLWLTLGGGIDRHRPVARPDCGLTDLPRHRCTCSGVFAVLGVSRFAALRVSNLRARTAVRLQSHDRTYLCPGPAEGLGPGSAPRWRARRARSLDHGHRGSPLVADCVGGLDGRLPSADGHLAPIHRAALQPLLAARATLRLRSRIDALLARCGFSAERVFVIDGSRRSSHGNAYFTGLGREKRVVFFDTLLSTLSPGSGRIRARARACALQASSHSAAPGRQSSSSAWPASRCSAGWPAQTWLQPALGVTVAVQCDAPAALRAGVAGLYLDRRPDRRRAGRAVMSSRPTRSPPSTAARAISPMPWSGCIATTRAR